jgi:GNAT superfamily N-acetyltransferase
LNDTKRIRQPEKNNILWRQLLVKLAKKLNGELDIVFPTELNRHSFSLFHGMEESGFRRELQYSFKELTKHLEKPELVFWFITADGKPQILLFGYTMPDTETKTFYLDTFAVRRRGEGIGDIVMEFLIRWAKTKQYQAIVLDTELMDEKGFPLQHFYAEHGFETIVATENNITMKRTL